MILCRIFHISLMISMQTLVTIIYFVLISKTLMFPCCFVDDSLTIFWRDIFGTLIVSKETFLIFIVFALLNSESLMFHCSFSDDMLMILSRNIDGTTKIWLQTLKIIEICNVIIIRTLNFPLLLDWSIVDDPMQNLWYYFDDFGANINDNFFVLISETLMFPCCLNDDSLMILRRDIFETLIISMETFLIFIVFDVLTSESFMFHCSFSDDSLMIFLRDLFGTLIVSMETLLIFIVFALLTSESLMFHCSFSDDSLMTLWRNIDGTTKIWMQTLKIIEVCNVIIIRTLNIPLLLDWLVVDDPMQNLWYYFDDFDANFSHNNLFCANLQNIDVSLPLRRWFVDDSFERHIWNIDYFDGNFFDLYCFHYVNLWIIHVSLLLQWWFVDDSLKKHWWHYEDLDASGRDNCSL